jgi:hypothetical protein
MRYKVKFVHPVTKEVTFGIYYSPYGGRNPKPGCIFMQHALTGHLLEVNENLVEDIPMDDYKEIDSETGFPIGSEYSRYINEEWKKHQAISDRCNGVQVGAMFTIGVADGQAHYVVTKVNKKTCHVEWRGFCGDRYIDHHFGWGGKFPIAEVERYVKGHQAMKKLFARK